MDLNWLEHYNLLTFESVDSTNTEALRLAKKEVRGDFVILAREQTGGRGQRGREWTSIDSNLHASILLDSVSEIKTYPQLSFVIANAMYDSIQSLATKHNKSLNIELKWPNDVLINGKKVSGILLESINFQGNTSIVIGFGVNIAETPAALEDIATSLREEGIELNGSEDFLNILMNNFDALYREWISDQSFIKTRRNWMQHAYNLGKAVTLDDGMRRVSGVFKDIDLDGSIRLQLSSGELCSFASGTVCVHEKGLI